MKNREPGPDLLRCLGLLLVMTFHSFLYNGYYSQPQEGLAMVLAGSVRWLSTSFIGIFLLLTGYLKSRETGMKACWRGLGPVVLDYLAASALSIPVRQFLLGDVRSFSLWLTRLVGFRGVYYGWYVEMYVGLALLTPFLNRLLQGLTRPRQWLGLCCVLLTLTALPGTTPLTLAPAWWRGIYPLTYYVLGAAIRRLEPIIPPVAGLMGAAAIALGMGTATVLSTGGTLSEALTWEFADLPVVAMAVCLFLALYRLRPGKLLSRVLAFGAGGCYGGYLLSHLADAWCYRWFPQYHVPARYPLLFLRVTVPIFLLSLPVGKALRYLTAKLPKPRKKAEHDPPPSELPYPRR